jgi:hypothetical protein
MTRDEFLRLLTIERFAPCPVEPPLRSPRNHEELDWDDSELTTARRRAILFEETADRAASAAERPWRVA